MTDNSTQLNNFYTPSITIRLLGATASAEGLVVEFSHDIGTEVYPWFWVRDHGIDPDSLDQGTNQRMVNTFALSADISCKTLEPDLAEQVIHFVWDDGTRSSISAYMLASVKGHTPELHELAPAMPQVLWNKEAPLQSMPRVRFDDVMNDDKGLLAWLQNIHIYGFSLVDGVPATEEGTEQLALRLGTVQETIFGGMWPLSSELTDHGDTAYSTSYLEPHTDGTYYHDAAGLQMFNCLDIDCKGGESIQLDGFAIAEKIKREDPDAYKTLTEVLVPGHYIEAGVHLRAERPVIRLDSQGNLAQISFNNYDRAPMFLSTEDQARFYHAYSVFHSHVIDQENWISIDMKPGTTLIFDNWRNMHGRMGYLGKRYFYGCYHSKAVFESQLRVLQVAG